MEASRLHSDTPSALPAGTRLGEFELLSVLGVGGFGIVYLAFDHALEREVAVKEYMPASLAGRTETMHVTLRSQNDAETFALGLKSFVNEARLLARFDHPSLLKVHRFWEANGTAYMAMPVMRGRTVKEIRLEMVGPPDEAWLRALLEPLLGAIEKLHSEGVYHRDIAPDNIQIEPGGRPVLLDFGAARRVLSDKSQTLTAILKPAYAPIEQYAEAGAVKQGPWTDIYALGATLHFLLLTRPPPPATTRAVHDEASLLTPLVLPGCSASFLNIIDWMLAPRPSDRPQSVAALRDVLEGREPPPVRRAPVPSVSQWDRTVMQPGLLLPGSDGMARALQPLPMVSDDEATVVLPRAAASARPVPLPPAMSKLAPPGPATAPPAAGAGARAAPQAPIDPPTPNAARSKLVPIGLGLAGLMVAALVAVLLSRQAPQPLLVAQPAASAPAPIAALPQPAPASVAESRVTTVTLPAVEAPPPPATLPATSSPPVIDRPAAPAEPVAVAPPPPVAARSPPAQQRQTGNTGALPSGRQGAAPAPPPDAPVVANPLPNVNPQPEPQRPPPVATAGTATLPTTPADSKPVVVAPEARCGGRNPLSYFVCMERECLRSESAGHADCLKWRQSAKRD